MEPIPWVSIIQPGKAMTAKERKGLCTKVSVRPREQILAEVGEVHIVLDNKGRLTQWAPEP